MANNKLLDSIINYVPEKERLQELANRADHAINAVLNILSAIDEEFSEEIADDLHRRLLLTIKNRDTRKFQKGLENIALAEKRERRK